MVGASVVQRVEVLGKVGGKENWRADEAPQGVESAECSTPATLCQCRQSGEDEDVEGSRERR